MSSAKIIINNLNLHMFIGIYEHEKENKQRVIVNAVLDVSTKSKSNDDHIDNVLNYETIVNGIKEIASQDHINLVETFAEYIADFCLKNERVSGVKIRVEKPDIFDDVDSVAVEITR